MSPAQISEIVMRDPMLPLVGDLRKLLSGYKSSEFTFQSIAKDLDLPLDTMVRAFGTEKGLVEEILNYEQQNLENIFRDFDFTPTLLMDCSL